MYMYMYFQEMFWGNTTCRPAPSHEKKDLVNFASQFLRIYLIGVLTIK